MHALKCVNRNTYIYMCVHSTTPNTPTCVTETCIYTCVYIWVCIHSATSNADIICISEINVMLRFSSLVMPSNMSTKTHTYTCVCMYTVQLQMLISYVSSRSTSCSGLHHVSCAQICQPKHIYICVYVCMCVHSATPNADIIHIFVFNVMLRSLHSGTFWVEGPQMCPQMCHPRHIYEWHI